MIQHGELRNHDCAAPVNTYLTQFVNIIKWVCYFSQGYATALYGSATLSLSLLLYTLDGMTYEKTKKLPLGQF